VSRVQTTTQSRFALSPEDRNRFARNPLPLSNKEERARIARKYQGANFLKLDTKSNQASALKRAIKK